MVASLMNSIYTFADIAVSGWQTNVIWDTNSIWYWTSVIFVGAVGLTLCKLKVYIRFVCLLVYILLNKPFLIKSAWSWHVNSTVVVCKCQKIQNGREEGTIMIILLSIKSTFYAMRRFAKYNDHSRDLQKDGLKSTLQKIKWFR